MKKISNDLRTAPTAPASLSTEALAAIDGGRLGFLKPKAPRSPAKAPTKSNTNPVTGSGEGQSFWNKAGDAAIFGTGFAVTGMAVEELFGSSDDTSQLIPAPPQL